MTETAETTTSAGAGTLAETEATAVVRDGDDPQTLAGLAQRARALFGRAPFDREAETPWSETPADALVSVLADAGLHLDYGRGIVRGHGRGDASTLAAIAEVIRLAEDVIDPR